jgi:hypothetical protein
MRLHQHSQRGDALALFIDRARMRLQGPPGRHFFGEYPEGSFNRATYHYCYLDRIELWIHDKRYTGRGRRRKAGDSGSGCSLGLRRSRDAAVVSPAGSEGLLFEVR